jgi:PIN domain nuclease of toxin-antitoxin system
VRGSEIVADASAILAALKNEPFSKISPERLVRASISAVNLSEVLTKLAADGLNQAQADAAAGALDLRVFPFDREQARTAADLWTATRRAGLSLGDRACLALALRLGEPVVTADRAWASVDVGVEIVLIR